MRSVRAERSPVANVRPYSLIPGFRPSRRILLGLLLFLGPRVGAQDTARVLSADSLLARLKALEASVEVLQKQVADAATTSVQTRSRVQFELNGRIVMNAFSNDRIVNSVDDPQFVRRDTSTAERASAGERVVGRCGMRPGSSACECFYRTM